MVYMDQWHQAIFIFSLFLMYICVFSGFMMYGTLLVIKRQTDHIPVFMVKRSLAVKRGNVFNYLCVHCTSMVYVYISTYLTIAATGKSAFLFYHVALLIGSIILEAFFITLYLDLEHRQSNH